MRRLKLQPLKRARRRRSRQAHFSARGGLWCRYSSRPWAALPLPPACARPTCPQPGMSRQPPSLPPPAPPEQLPSRRQLSPVQPTACRRQQTSFGRTITAPKTTCPERSQILHWAQQEAQALSSGILQTWKSSGALTTCSSNQSIEERAVLCLVCQAALTALPAATPRPIEFCWPGCLSHEELQCVPSRGHIGRVLHCLSVRALATCWLRQPAACFPELHSKGCACSAWMTMPH